MKVKKLLVLILGIMMFCQLWAGEKTKGSFEVVDVEATSLSNNIFGESTKRQVIVYLPPDYQNENKRYPVLYYMPGYTITAYNVVGSIALGFPITDIMDEQLKKGNIGKMIVVAVDGVNIFSGSFFVNSPLTGNWEDYIVKDLVNYIDSNYRTIAKASSRAICGHSMGGFGALYLALRHPETFSVVYAMSAGILDREGVKNSTVLVDKKYEKDWFNLIETLEKMSKEEALKYIRDNAKSWRLTYDPKLFSLAYGCAFAYDSVDKPPFIKYPKRKDGSFDEEVVLIWNNGFGNWEKKIEDYKNKSIRLKAIAWDCGNQDEYEWIPRGAKYLDELMMKYHIPHTYFKYDGTHISKRKERFEQFALPFIWKNLEK
ncbi:MAG: alpha/beta hydrolase [Brevinematia bacterium]